MASGTSALPSEQNQVPAAQTGTSTGTGTRTGTGTETETDPHETILEFLQIVDSLHQKVSEKTKEADQIRKSKSVPAAKLGEMADAAAEIAKKTGSAAAEKTGPETTPIKPKMEKLLSLQVKDLKLENKEDLQTSKLQRNLRLLKEDVLKLQDLRVEVAEEVSKHIRPLEMLLKKVAKDEKKLTPLTKGMKKDLEVINKKIFNLMCQVPLLPNKRKKGKGEDSEDGEKENDGKGIVCLPGIHADEADLKRRAVFRYVLDEFKNLENEWRIYLLSFAVFPENQEVNRTMLMYWWIGEGLLTYKLDPPAKGILPDEKKPENVVKGILQHFVDRNLIEAVENDRKVEPNSYKMNPFVHSSLVQISKEIGLFDMYSKGDQPRMDKSKLNKVCLVEESSSQPEAKAKKMSAEGIETVFNVSERFPDFAFKWFPEEHPSRHKMFGPLSKTTYKMLKVFYLGRWERTAKRHIEVENPELMKNLQHMTKLKLLSFQGISRIERLDDAVCKLQELIILDLRACYNLEKLPEKIDFLKALIYLDITDCYMIDRMPKRLSWLKNLEVLKGFVVSDADEETVCTLAELKYLTKLRKLTITINKGDFKVKQLFTAIKTFKSLEKLKVAWGGINEHPDKSKDGDKKLEDIDDAAEDAVKPVRSLSKTFSKVVFGDKEVILDPGIPDTLKKLDLQCFPNRNLPEWLKPSKLVNLEKFYIKGGTELTGFGDLPGDKTHCTVKVLRLKFLPKLKVEWRDLRHKYFPKLTFLEKYQCPQISLCPTDGIGIWRNPE